MVARAVGPSEAGEPPGLGWQRPPAPPSALVCTPAPRLVLTSLATCEPRKAKKWKNGETLEETTSTETLTSGVSSDMTRTKSLLGMWSKETPTKTKRLLA